MAKLPLVPHYCVRQNSYANWGSENYPHTGKVLKVTKSNTFGYVRIHIGNDLDPVHYIEANVLAVENLIRDLQELVDEVKAAAE